MEITISRKRPLPSTESIEQQIIRRILAYNKHFTKEQFIDKPRTILLAWVPPLDRPYFQDIINIINRKK